MHAHSISSKLAVASLLLTALTPFVAAQSGSDDLESSLDGVFSSAFPSTTDEDTATDTDTAAGQTITGGITGNTGTIGNGVECPGVLNGGNDATAYCCVGGSLTLSTCPGWPICTGPGTVDTETQTESCVTKIPITQSDYSAVISSYSQGLLTGSSDGQSGSSGATGASGSSSGATETSGSTGSSGGGSSGAQETGSSSSDSSGGRVGPMGVVAGGLLGLAAML